MKSKQNFLIATILVAVLVRAYGLWAFPFEQDELYTIDEATNLFHTKLLPGIQARPVFFLMEHPIMSLPHTPLVLRAIPFIFGILGVWITWILAKSLLGPRGGGVAALMAAISPWHIYASGFGRYYSLIYVLAALVYWLLPRAYDTDERKYYLATLAPMLIGAWTHPSFIFPVAGAALALTLVGRDGRIRWIWPTKTAWKNLWIPLVGCSVLILAAVRVFHHTATVANGGDRGLLATLRLIPAMVDWMTVTVFVAAILGAFVLLASAVPGRRRTGTVILFGVTGMIVALFALSFVTAIYADYGIAALPLVFVAVAALVEWVAESAALERQGGIARAVTTVLAVGVLPSMLSHLSDGTRFDYRPAFAKIVATAPTQAVLTWPIILQRHYAPQLRAYELPTTTAGLDSALAREGELWAVISVKRYGIVGDDQGAIAGWLSTHCRQVSQYQRPRLDYRVYRVDLWECTAGSSPHGIVDSH